ncbi:hypothetical protein CLU99_1989 [Flavobacterium sp. 2]|nr:hypothetical protein CLU99_1989 [Flavobacterium sp. 2]
MKQIKFISVILLFLLTFTSSAEYFKHPSEFSVCHGQDFLSTSEIPEVLPSALIISKDLDIHFIVKKKMKSRAVSSDSNILKSLYFTKLVHFKVFEDSLIYGIANIYQIQRHTHLHLYQLF